MKKSTQIAAALQRSGLVLLCAFFFIFLYTTLHESGHALAALLCGGTVRHIDVNFLNLSAHAVTGGDFTPGQNAFIAVAGWALPVLVFLLFLLLGRKGRNPLLLIVRWIGGFCLLGSTLPWVVLPLVYLGGGCPADDVTNFLNFSALPPQWVALGFAALVAGGIALLVAGRRQLHDYRDWLFADEPPMADPGTRRTLAVMALLAAALAVGLLIVNGRGSAAAVPQGYRSMGVFDLAQATPSDQTLFAFDLAAPGPLGVYLAARQVDADALDLSIHGPDGWSFPLLKSGELSAGEILSNPTWQEMPAGHYEVTLAGSTTRGKVEIYLKP